MTAVVVEKSAAETAAILARINSNKVQHKAKPASETFITKVKTEPRKNALSGKMEETIVGGSTRIATAVFGNGIKGLDRVSRKGMPKGKAA